MDYDNLIEQYRQAAIKWEKRHPVTDTFDLRVQDALRDAATALSTLQAENERLRGELEYEREHANAYLEECGQWEAENEKLRAELESKEKYYEQMIDALSAIDSADLAQMTACVYYKPGGLCRYCGDNPANVCVLGPCPHERTAEEVLADLARMTTERDAAVEDLEEIMFKGGHNIDTCHFCTNGQCYGRGGTQVCEPKWRGIKED